MKDFKEKECDRQQKLINESKLFDGMSGGGKFRGNEYAHILKEGVYNLYASIREEAIKYFKSNGISWWGGFTPTGNILSSQIACLNHLFMIKNDQEAVLALLNGIKNEFTEVLAIPSDKEPAYISFEVISDKDHLNEKTLSRGSNCTSIDAFIYARHKSGALWLVLIEWKYTEHYGNEDKSNEDRESEAKGTNGKGIERMSRYNDLISSSKQLKTLEEYKSSIYYYEPFYQLMRQTLWAENVIKNKDDERLKADDFLHIHVIPSENDELLKKNYKVSGKSMEDSWREMITDQEKYIIVDPEKLLEPICGKYPELAEYLKLKYWNR